jgi:nucleotide-binding universal stress UspA family protein
MPAVVVGYDGSDAGRAALDTALGVGHLLGDRVIVVFAYEVSRLGGEVPDYAKALRERAEEVIGHARHHAEAQHVPIEAEIVEQDPAQALVDVAKQHDARMIVVGSLGERPLKGVVVGSTPYRLLHIADRPVLVVPTA